MNRQFPFLVAAAFALAAQVLVAETVLSGQETVDTASAMQVTKPSDRTIVITRSFAAERQKVFDAMTRQDQVPLWFQPTQMSLVAYESDLKVGGTVRYVFQRPEWKKDRGARRLSGS